MPTAYLRAALGAAFLWGSATAQATTAPCFESNLGTDLGLGDDAVAGNIALGFSFPAPGGAVTAIDISSNGFVWLRRNQDNGCCSGDLTAFLSGGPRIAAFWTDLDPSAAGPNGGVFFQTFAVTPSSQARAVITWAELPLAGGATHFTIQLQLLDNGDMAFWYSSEVENTGHTALVGVTEGNAGGAPATANPLDLSAITVFNPYFGLASKTLHEVFTAPFDLEGCSFELVATGAGYILADRPTCQSGHYASYGRGCPAPTTVYERFPSAAPIDLANRALLFSPNGSGGWQVAPTTGFFTGLVNAISTGDDVVSGPFPLPFPWPFPGGSTTAIDVDSNGCIALVSGAIPSSRCCNGDPAEFVADPATIAALWMDLNPAPGSVFVDHDPSGQATHVTWSNVSEYPQLGANTCQVSLFANGSFRLSYQAVANSQHDVLVGFSPGVSTFVPAGRDLSAAPFDTGAGGVPLRLLGGARPAIGQAASLRIADIPPGSFLGLIALGLQPVAPPVHLQPIGMVGCLQHTTVDSTVIVPLTGNPTTYSYNLINDIALLGLVVHAQAATWTPAINPLGVATSNGVEIHIGR